MGSALLPWSKRDEKHGLSFGLFVNVPNQVSHVYLPVLYDNLTVDRWLIGFLWFSTFGASKQDSLIRSVDEP